MCCHLCAQIGFICGEEMRCFSLESNFHSFDLSTSRDLDFPRTYRGGCGESVSLTKDGKYQMPAAVLIFSPHKGNFSDKLLLAYWPAMNMKKARECSRLLCKICLLFAVFKPVKKEKGSKSLLLEINAPHNYSNTHSRGDDTDLFFYLRWSSTRKQVSKN